MEVVMAILIFMPTNDIRQLKCVPKNESERNVNNRGVEVISCSHENLISLKFRL